MIVIGIDVSKETMVGVAINRFSRVKETFTFGNDEPAINTWINDVNCKYKNITVASEATAEYHRRLALACLKQGIKYRLLNPIVTKQFTKSTVRKRKTDQQDALIIAKLALTGVGNMVTEESFDIAKSYTRMASKLVHMENQLALMSKRVLDIAPEDKESASSLDDCINQLKVTVKFLRSKGFERVDKQKEKLLETIPGIGPVISTTLLAEIGNINNFNSAKSLVAFVGIDPRVKQSGAGFKHNTHITKRGSPYLRQALFQATQVARIHNKELNIYYQKKRSEGKRYKEAIIATSRKLLYRVFAVLKRNSGFVERG